ncbi:MAG: methyl-accepting chemotaxis protein [Elusimicrobiota bacterium]|jgi:signal transduction histidine kinase|nr:methyl-accepting chemotaxis protein [Elusimicrobiota bacterium]
MANKKFQRKILFIKKPFQYKMILFVLFSVLFCLSFVAYEFINLAGSVFKDHPVLIQVFFEKGYDMLFVFLLKIIVCCVVFALITAILSNKIAGPMYKLEMTCKKIAQGDYSARAVLRDGDACEDLADEFNAMMDTLEPKLKSGNIAEDKLE